MKATNLKLISVNKEGVLYQVDLEYKKWKHLFKRNTIKVTELIFIKCIGGDYGHFAYYHDSGKEVNSSEIGYSMHLANIIKHDLEKTKHI